MLPTGESTMCRIFVAWVVYMEVVFTFLNFKPDDTLLLHSMPEVLIKTGYVLKGTIIDSTEFKFQQPGNYDLSTLTSSKYRNRHALGKI